MASDRSSLGVAVAVAVVVFAVVLAVIVVVRRPPEPLAPGYSDDTRAAFLTSCTTGGGETRSTCECAYDKIVQSVPYARYLELNDDIARRRSSGSTVTGSAPSPTILPNDLEVLVVSCIARQTISAAPTTTAVVQRATTTTTGAPSASSTTAPSTTAPS